MATMQTIDFGPHNIPRKVTEKIANRAVEEVKAYGRSQGWKATNFVKPYARVNIWGIRLNGRYWLRYQNDGISPFVMYSLEGKTIPMNFGFRKAIGVGEPGFVNIDGDKVWRDEKWKHPGLKPRHFIDNALAKAYKLYEHDVMAYQPLTRFVRMGK